MEEEAVSEVVRLITVENFLAFNRRQHFMLYTEWDLVHL
jgi:hypothetical protein